MSFEAAANKDGTLYFLSSIDLGGYHGHDFIYKTMPM